MPRPLKVATTADMVRAAQLYFREKKSKKEIAVLMRTDIRGVTWLLNEAEAKNLVRINIHETTESNLEVRIKERFPHLERVIVIPGPPIKSVPHYEFFLKRADCLRRTTSTTSSIITRQVRYMSESRAAKPSSNS